MRSDAWNGYQLLAALTVARAWLAQHAAQLDAENIFPVPDGDTGANMLHTLRGALAHVQPNESAAVVAAQIGRGALLSGRGNSGLILGQLLYGLAHGLAGRTHFVAQDYATALQLAVEYAYRAVVKPVEGTMLTVARAASDAAHAASTTPLLNAIDASARAAAEALKRTPQLLDSLRAANVVDAGGHGLALIFEGLARYSRGERAETMHEAAHVLPAIPAAIRHAHTETNTYGYCTNIAIGGQALPVATMQARFAALGDSVAVAGDTELVRIHLHTFRPGDALNAAIEFGTLLAVDVTWMDGQVERTTDHRPPTADRQTSTGDDGRWTMDDEPSACAQTADHGPPTAAHQPQLALSAAEGTADDGPQTSVHQGPITEFTGGVIALAPTPEVAAIYAGLGAHVLLESDAPNLHPSPTAVGEGWGVRAASPALLPPAPTVVEAHPGVRAASTFLLRTTTAPAFRDDDLVFNNFGLVAVALAAQRFDADQATNRALMHQAATAARSMRLERVLTAKEMRAFGAELDLDESEVISVYYSNRLEAAVVVAWAADVQRRYPNLVVEVYAAGAVTPALLVVAE